MTQFPALEGTCRAAISTFRMEANRTCATGYTRPSDSTRKSGAWVEDQARQHVDWCRRFDIVVEFGDAFGDVVDTEIEGFASKDWTKVSLACHMLGFDDFTARSGNVPRQARKAAASRSCSARRCGNGSWNRPAGTICPTW